MGGMTAGIVTIGAINSNVAPAAAEANGSVNVTNAVGGTQIFAANNARKYLLIQNPAGSGVSLFLRTDGNAPTTDTNSIELTPGQSYEPSVVPTGAIRGIVTGAAAVNMHATQA